MAGSLPETMISMVATAAMAVGFVQFVDLGRTENAAYGTSLLLLEFLDGAQAYASQRQSTLNGSIAASGEAPVAMTRSALVGAGALATSFPVTTPFGQTLAAYITRNAAADPAAQGVSCSSYTSAQGTCPLEVMVVASGGVAPRGDLRGAVARYGQTRIGEVTAGNIARGPGWSVSLAPYQGGGTSFQIGQLVARANIAAIQATPWVSRTAIDGHPELNRMSQTLTFESGAGAHIDLNGNDVRDGGEIRANAFVYGSDCRIKEGLRRITPAEAADLVKGVEVYRYRYSGETRERIGVIAQNIEEVAPEAVYKSADGVLQVDYAQLAVLLFAALAERTAEDGDAPPSWSCPAVPSAGP